MKRIFPAVAAALAIAACSEKAEQPPANDPLPAEEAEARPQEEVPSLAGRWSVTQINGGAPAQVWPMSAEVADGRFTIVSECRRMSWTLKQDRNVVQFTPQPGGDCARVRSPAEIVIDKAIKLATIAMFTDQGRTVELSGAGGRVLMTRR